MNRLRLKQTTGWFAADDSFKRALRQLSDGAFKLFALLCLEADRPSGRLAFRQAQLAQKLGKSRRSVGTYLRQLQQKGICRVASSSNQYESGILLISPQYWPYETDSLQTTESSPEETAYLEAIQQLYSARRCVPFSLSEADRCLARKWFRQSIALSVLEQAILLGCGRKYVSWLNGQNTEPIGSLYYFDPILQELLSQNLSPDYCNFNRQQVDRLERRWLKLNDENPNSACEKFAQPNPSKKGETR
jgi:biotin operon repressor